MEVLRESDEAIDYRVELRGAIFDLLNEVLTYDGPPKVEEILLEGPAGTGKSRGCGHLLFVLGEQFPGIRMLVVRETRASLTDSFMVTFEEQCVPEGHEILQGATRMNRHSYQWRNGAELVCGGLDTPEKLYSTEWDVIVVQQAEETSEAAWAKLKTRVRPRPGSAFNCRVMVADVNPDAPGHWLNQRAELGLTRRLVTTHKDNPAYWDRVNDCPTQAGKPYLEALDALPPVIRDRLYLGKWVQSEGAVWENWDPRIHLIDPTFKEDGTLDLSPLGLKSFFGAYDYGFVAPACLHVWGVDGERRIVCVAEVYRAKQGLEWWAERVVELEAEFGLQAIVCDPSAPKAIETFNDFLVRGGFERLAWGADNTKASRPGGDLAGLDLVRWGLCKDAAGIPRIRFLRHNLRAGRDDELQARRQPFSTPQEIPSYVFRKDAEGRVLRDQTDEGCADHGCDTTRYAASWNWRRDMRPGQVPETFKPGTFGYLLGTPQSLEAERRRKLRTEKGRYG